MTRPVTPSALIPARDLRLALTNLAVELAPRVSRLDRGECLMLLVARFDLLVQKLAPADEDG